MPSRARVSPVCLRGQMPDLLLMFHYTIKPTGTTARDHGSERPQADYKPKSNPNAHAQTGAKCQSTFVCGCGMRARALRLVLNPPAYINVAVIARTSNFASTILPLAMWGTCRIVCDTALDTQTGLARPRSRPLDA